MSIKDDNPDLDKVGKVMTTLHWRVTRMFESVDTSGANFRTNHLYLSSPIFYYDGLGSNLCLFDDAL